MNRDGALPKLLYEHNESADGQLGYAQVLSLRDELEDLVELVELVEDVLRIESMDDGKPMDSVGDAGEDLGDTPRYIAAGVIFASDEKCGEAMLMWD